MSNKNHDEKLIKETLKFREQLLERLDLLNRRILGLGAALSNKKDEQKVRYLAKGDLTQPEMGILLCKNQGDISQILTGKKKGKTKK